VIWSFVYLAVRELLAVIVLIGRSDRSRRPEAGRSAAKRESGLWERQNEAAALRSSNVGIDFAATRSSRICPPLLNPVCSEMPENIEGARRCPRSVASAEDRTFGAIAVVHVAPCAVVSAVGR
jgi:hypothetical protein